MKKIFKRGVPLFMALLVLLGVTFSSFESVNATGMETLYYTYWDLMTSVFAAQGYDMQIKDGVVNDHGVTGKQVWENFKTWVKTNAKAVYDEVTLLPKAVTAEGIKMSQELWDAFKNYAASIVSYETSMKNNTLISETLPYGGFNTMKCNFGWGKPDKVISFNFAYSSASVDFIAFTEKDISGKYNVSLYAYSSDIFYIYAENEEGRCICNNVPNGYDALTHAYGYHYVCVRSVHSVVEPTCSPFKVVTSASSIDEYLRSLDAVPKVIRPSDYLSIVSQGACPAEVPDVTPWIKNPTIPDEWRIVQPNEDPKKDPDSNPEKLPVIIPFKPPKPEDPKKPDSTEDTNPDKDKDKDKEKKPAVNPIINPATGNVIDPETGLDIDPNTGKLIDPDTGKLIDPDDGGSGGGGGGGIADKLGKYGDITKLFPFCIPFDIVNLIKGMSAEKAPPVFHFKYYFKSINYTFKVDVDLSKYAKYIKLFRYGMQIFYILALMFMTIRISKLFS